MVKQNNKCKQGANTDLNPRKVDPLKFSYLATVLGLSCQKEAYTILQDFQANLSLFSSS